jgi:hypothetical protein
MQKLNKQWRIRQCVRSNGGGDEDRGRERDRCNEAIVTSGEVEFATLFASNLQWKVSRILWMVTVLVLRDYMRKLDWNCVQGRGYCDYHRIHLENYPSISRFSHFALSNRAPSWGIGMSTLPPPPVLKWDPKILLLSSTVEPPRITLSSDPFSCKIIKQDFVNGHGTRASGLYEEIGLELCAGSWCGYCDYHRIHLENYPSISRFSKFALSNRAPSWGIGMSTLLPPLYSNEILRFFSWARQWNHQGLRFLRILSAVK